MTEAWRKLAFDWALANMPMESCGLVIVEKGREVFVPCTNRSPLTDFFELCPKDFAAAEERGEVVRVIHSHVFQRPHPSGVDKAACEASALPWSIVSVPTGEWFDFKPNGYKSPLIGREWVHGPGDCYALIRDYFREILSIDIPDFDREFEWWKKGGNLYVENFESAGFSQVPISEMKENDVLLMQIRSKVINHGAVYIGGGFMLHHLHRRLSCREMFGGYWQRNTVKVVRHRSFI